MIKRYQNTSALRKLHRLQNWHCCICNISLQSLSLLHRRAVRALGCYHRKYTELAEVQHRHIASLCIPRILAERCRHLLPHCGTLFPAISGRRSITWRCNAVRRSPCVTTTEDHYSTSFSVAGETRLTPLVFPREPVNRATNHTGYGDGQAR